MELYPRIWVDWNDMYGPEMVELYLDYTLEHFVQQGLQIKEGVKIRLFGDRLEADAVVTKIERNGRLSFIARIIEGTLIESPSLIPAKTQGGDFSKRLLWFTSIS